MTGDRRVPLQYGYFGTTCVHLSAPKAGCNREGATKTSKGAEEAISVDVAFYCCLVWCGLHRNQVGGVLALCRLIESTVTSVVRI